METKNVEIKKAFSFGWQSAKKDFLYFVYVAAIAMVISGILGKLGEKNFIFAIVGWVIGFITTCGIARITVDYVRGTKRELETLFTEWQYFWRVVGACIFMGILIIIGLVLLVVPGIYLIFRFQFVTLFIVDKNMKIREAMKASTEMTKGIKWQLFRFALVSIGVALLGVLALGVGIFIAVPIIWLAQAYIYNSLLSGNIKEEIKIDGSVVATN
ncbi:MAG: hypothetical protein LiPW41_499 [Parcubacteria group bacterium LiPW_41]|nr:MAG: hypothetical protein LiPW41_499 [Parcubacteria group bacterium LiPW_41]